MSDGYMFADEVLNEKPRALSRGDRILKRVLLVLAVVLGAEMVWLFALTPCMPFTDISISGIPGVSDDLVLVQAGINTRSSFVNLDVRKARKALEALPLVESARVEKHFPGGLSIHLEGRRAVALSLAQVQNRMTPVFLDKHGVAFRVGGAGPTELAEIRNSLPIVSGLVFEQLSPGTRLPPMFKDFFHSLEGIEQNSPALLAAISEIRIQRKPYDGFDLVLYPVHKAVRVRMGSELNEDTLRYMMLVVDVLSSENPNIEEIDFRTGTASYTVKEASAG